jgi:radical SAM superfamily enzyme YgiQ (UPF0313 family)
MDSKKVVILSVPYTEPLPMVAPILLSACLTTKGISAKGIDFSVEFFNHFYHQTYWPALKNLITIGVSTKLPRRYLIDILKFTKNKLLAIQQEYNPEYIGLSIFTNESIDFTNILIYSIRKYLPDVKIILGGRGLELICGVENIPYYQKYFNHSMADLIIVGDAEESLISAINEKAIGIYKSKQQTRADLLTTPIPNWDDYNLDVYKNFKDYAIQEDNDHKGKDPRYISITGSKGCVRECSFCDVASFWPKYIYRDGDIIAKEIITAYEKTGIVNFKFTDNLMNGSIKQYRIMNQVLSSTIPNTISYTGYAIFRGQSELSEEDFATASRAGCKQWSIGVESGSENVRYHMKKKFSNDDLDYSIRQLHKNNIAQSWLIMVGYPTETEKDFLDTVHLLERYKQLNANNMIDISFTNFQVLHNSPLITNSEVKESLGIQYDHSAAYSRFFWTCDSNPTNTFIERYNRWHKLLTTVTDCGYNMQNIILIKKWKDELENLKTIYAEHQPKKMFYIRNM